MIRGAHFLPIGKIYFIVTGYVIYASLSRILSPEEFGRYGVVIGLVSVLNMMFITGTMQSVSKKVSENSQARNVIRTAFKVQRIFGTAVFVGLVMAAPILAQFFRDMELASSLRLAAIILFAYSFYAIYIGGLNGLKQFKQQGIFDMIYATIKTALVIALASTTFGAKGAVGGFALAALLIMVFCWLYVSKCILPMEASTPKMSISLKAGDFFRFQILVMGFSLIMNFFINTDLFLVKRLAESTVENSPSGLYTAALTIARIPYMLLASVTIIIFPILSRSLKADDLSLARQSITHAMRLAGATSAVFVVCIVTASSETLQLLYPVSYGEAGSSLSILAIHYLLICLLVIALTAITAGGKPAYSLFFAIVAWIIQVISGHALIPSFGINGAAISSLIASFAGCLFSAIYLFNRYRWLPPFRSIVKVLICALLVGFLCNLINVDGIYLIFKNIAVGLVFLILLFVTRECTVEEWVKLKNALWSKTNTSPL